MKLFRFAGSTAHSTADIKGPSTPTHPGAQPFSFGSGDIGLLIIHGYGGSIGDYRQLGRDFAARGYRVHGMAMAGHGAKLRDLAQADTAAWRQSVFDAARDLRRQTKRIAVIGFSFGGSLAIDYASHIPEVAAVMTVNTALRYKGGGALQIPLLKLLRFFTPYYPKRNLSREDKEHMVAIGSLPKWPIDGILETYKFNQLFVIPALPRLTSSLLVVSGSADTVADSQSAEQIYALAGSSHKERWNIEGASHRPTRDEKIRLAMADRMDKFIQAAVARSK